MPAAVDTRPPLHNLRMSAAQRPPKRRSERLQRDDEDGFVTKKARTERSSPGRAVGSEAQASKTRTSGRKTKASYEDQDGFTFKRTGSKRQKLKPTIEEEEKVDESIAIVETERPVRAPRSRHDAPPALPSSQAEVKEVQTMRKSQRISSSPAPGAGPAATPLKFKARRKTTLAPVEAPPTPESQPIEERVTIQQPVEETSSGTRVISLPFADTPVIQRNKEFRAKSKTQNRRSSSGLRGRRASSLIDGGNSSGELAFLDLLERHEGRQSVVLHPEKFARRQMIEHLDADVSGSETDDELVSILMSGLEMLSFIDDRIASPEFGDVFADCWLDLALPHGEVETRDLYKHIEQSLLEPQRMKQLLVWCGTRSMLPKQHGGLKDASEGLAVDSARQIQEELLKDVMSKPEMSNWFSRNDVEPTTIVKKPNPRNMQNTTKLREIEQEVERLRLEKAEWDTILEQSKKTLPLEPLTPLNLTPRPETTEPANTDLATSILSALAQAQESNKTTRDRVSAIAARVEPSIDLLADGLHRIGQYRLAATGIAERILESATKSLESEQQRVNAASGTQALSHKDLLGALGDVLKRQRD